MKKINVKKQVKNRIKMVGKTGIVTIGCAKDLALNIIATPIAIGMGVGGVITGKDTYRSFEKWVYKKGILENEEYEFNNVKEGLI